MGKATDEYFEQAAKLVIEKDKASIGMLQRALQINFSRASELMDQLCAAGVVGEDEGSRPRDVLMTMEELQEYLTESEEEPAAEQADEPKTGKSAISMTMMTGHCRYCYDAKMIEVPQTARQETVNEIVTAECTCAKAKEQRERIAQRKSADYQIEQIIKPRSETAANLMYDAIEAIQMGHIRKITIETPDKWTVSMQRTPSGIRINAKTTYIEEEEVY